MKIKIDDQLYSVYPDIRLGLLQFQADVKESDKNFWECMNHTVLPKYKKQSKENSGMRFLVLKEAGLPIKLSEGIREDIEFLLRLFYEEFVEEMHFIRLILW